MSNSTAPRVAILSAYCNRQHAVERTLLSIAAQTYRDYQALVWDDCSSDDTWAEMSRVASKVRDRRLNVYRHQANVGLTAGLNDAVGRTTAEYIAIVGSGDLCHPERIARQVAALDASPDAVFCATASTTTDPVRNTTFLDDRFDGEVITERDIALHCPFTHGSVMYRRSALVDIGLYEPAFKWCADWDVFFRLLRGRKAVYLPEVLYERTAQLDGVSFSPKKAFEQIAYKHLALKLSTCSTVERERILEDVRKQGLPSAIQDRREGISRDLARRNIKLYLMGRSTDGDTMHSIAREEDYPYPLKYRLYLPIARQMGRTGINPDSLIRAARALPR